MRDHTGNQVDKHLFSIKQEKFEDFDGRFDVMIVDEQSNQLARKAGIHRCDLLRLHMLVHSFAFRLHPFT